MSTTTHLTVLRWLGQACFLITLLHGTRVLIDPPHPQVGYKIAPRSIPANIVFVSHEHFDHNFTDAAASVREVPPRIIAPLALSADQLVESGTDTRNVQHAAPVAVPFTRISAYHDQAQGAQRGQDTITVIQDHGLRICHLGDLGQLALTPAQLTAIGRVDVLMIPVGGFFTIDGAQAAAIVAQLHPRVILPMHYQTPALAPDLKAKLHPVSEFLTAMQGKAVVVHVAARDLTLSPATLPKTPTIYVLRYE